MIEVSYKIISILMLLFGGSVFTGLSIYLRKENIVIVGMTIGFAVLFDFLLINSFIPLVRLA